MLPEQGGQIGRIASAAASARSPASASEREQVRAIAAADLLSERELHQKMNGSIRPTLEEQCQIEKTLLHKQFGPELIDSLTYTQKKSGETFTGVAAAVLKNRQNRYKRELDAFYFLQAPMSEAALRDWEREDK